MPGGVESGEGRLGVLLNAKAEFDDITAPTDAASWAPLNDQYDAMVVWSPYFDSRLALFEGDAYAYQDLYGLKVNDPGDTRAADHPDWVLRTADGEPTYIPFDCEGAGGCPQFAADLAHPEVQDAFIAGVAALVDKGYGGVMIDDVNLAWRISDVNGNRAAPISPRTGEELLLSEWRAAVVTVTERLRAEFPDLLIMHNSIWFADQPNYDNINIDRQIMAADIIMMERGATDPGITGGSGAFSFGKFVEYLDRVHGHGAEVLLLDETATTEREQVFNLATGLLVNQGDDLTSTEAREWIGPESFWSGYAIDLGPALGPYQESGGVWRRDFERGTVVVHEPGSTTVEVDLGGEFIDASGASVTSVVLSGREASILRLS